MNIARGLNLDLFTNANRIKLQEQSPQEGDDLNKGHVSDAVRSLHIPCKYKGSEVKQSLSSIMEKISERCTELSKELDECRSNMGDMPEEPCPEWKIKSCLACFDEYPKMYSMKQIRDWCTRNDCANDYYKSPGVKYNDVLGQYIDCLGDKQNAAIAIKHIKEDMEYHMTVQQAVQLGLK